MRNHFFLNDHLFEPCNTAEESLELLERMVSLAATVLRVNQPVYFNGDLFLRIIMYPDINVSSVLRNNRELKGRFSRIVQQLEAFVSKADVDARYCFYHKGDIYDVSGSTVAHAYEYMENDDKSSLLSFREDYPGLELSVTKDAIEPRVLSNHTVKNELVKYLQKLGLLKRYYSPKDTHVPNDYETILTDTQLFIPTEFGNRNNRLYRRIEEPNQLWCLDRGHRGSSAHLEVFRESDGLQIAVSKVDEINFFRNLTDKESTRILIKEKMP